MDGRTLSHVHDEAPQAAVDVPEGPQLRPQSLMFAFFGGHVLEEGPLCVYSGSVIDVLARAGVGEQAVRSTLTRMVNRGLLRRQREGRRMYFGLTPQATEILWNGRKRLRDTGAVNDDWDGTWTLLGFSLPESCQRQRHDLRSRLTWSGFGPLYSGLWIAPGDLDVSELVSELGLTAHVKIFHATADEATDIGLMIRDTWDLDGVGARYADFDKRWTDGPSSGPSSGSGDPLGTQLRLTSEWLRIIRTDPRLPARHLPAAWPARSAHDTFHRIAEQTEEPALRIAADLMETAPLRPS
ncbi:PaaX family transcriptional regulator C-terminal domain-containing protein [Streptomyces sp. NBC_00878]|uniref:PaaX family transcriptional regulator n=1 Tax=Streptomyces sp. NBC_00878 TaxID=2975854 RepID=UPI00225C1AB9|nr:PaaX family transcriptional regulator C-terminal domain-containing protein [Streptomyces sp. NBC_00878]MCX4903043.1 PaaX family transcriptional regulator [Streptomyces sp. NBC_00878]